LSEEKLALIKITLNGKPSEIQAGITVSDLLLKWRVRPELVTVEVNEEILQKLDYDSVTLKNGDAVNFVFYMGGGAPRVLPPAGTLSCSFVTNVRTPRERGLPSGVTRG
jgi:thiamine biosynthesis protein ThiS